MTRRTVFLTFILAPALGLAISGCAAPGGGAERFTAANGIVYTPPDWPAPLKADVFQPAAVDRMPAVILLHPSGTVGRDLRWQMRGIARRLASRGYFVLNATYRSAPAWQYPAPLEDMNAALDWMEENAARLGIDTGRIALWGYSAGGHLALLSGLGDDRVKAIVAGAAPADLTVLQGGRLIRAFAGGTLQERSHVYQAASPAFWVHSRSPPVFLYHGERDEIVPVDQAHGMKRILDEAGVPNELIVLRDKDHVMGFLLAGKAEARAIDFLDRHLR